MGALEEGDRLAERGDLSAAERAYERAAQAGNPTALAYSGVFAEARGDLGEAESAYRRADAAGDGYAAFRLGLLLSRTGDWDGAVEAWRRAEERGKREPPFDPVALIRRQAGLAGAAPEVAREAARSAFANPVLLGAVTVLVLIIGVFLAYNANSGLPFVPTRQLKVDLPNGAALVAGNDVYSGGSRVGLVSELHPVRMADGQVGAQVVLQLNRSFGPVPVDSTVSIRPRSVLGLKYVDLQRGTSQQTFPDGGTLPRAQTSIPVQFDDINKLFDAKTRPAVQQDLQGFGDVLAARGSALNDTIASLPALFLHLQPVAQYLSDPRTGLTRFLGALNGFFSTVSPVAHQNVRLFADQATTFAAISHSSGDLEATIRKSPPTLDVSTASLRAQQPFLGDLTTFSNYLAPATAALQQALPQANPALEAGIRVLPRTPSVNAKLQGVLAALRSLAQAPGTNVALNGLTDTVGILNPMIRYLGPFVSVCNTWNYMWTDFADHVSEQTQFGHAERVLINFANHQTNNFGSQGAYAPMNGYLNTPADQAAAAPSAGADAEYVHGPSYSAAVGNSGLADCEAGQRGYPLKVNSLDVPRGRMWDYDVHTLGLQGPNWTGLSRVPPGQTFTRSPQTGPQVPSIPGNQ